jgi:hypothetical protein
VPLLQPTTREKLPDELRPLWDECERLAPSFRHLWATMANSPTVFRHVWGQLLELNLGPLPDDHAFPPRPGFSDDESLVIDLAHFLVWAGIHARTTDVHPRLVHMLRRRLHARLAQRFSPRQLEEMTWRFAQCVAFNWHNEFLEIDAP